VARRTAAAGNRSLALLHRARVARADDHDRLSVHPRRKGAGGAIRRTTMVDSSSGALPMKSR
jgi:hypothetical protein